jgi:hypothetical protein
LRLRASRPDRRVLRSGLGRHTLKPEPDDETANIVFSFLLKT